MAEIDEAFYALQLINTRRGELVSKSNLRKKGNVGSSSQDLDDIEWSDWTGRISLDNVTSMGHSFGGATTVQLARPNDRFPWIAQG